MSRLPMRAILTVFVAAWPVAQLGDAILPADGVVESVGVREERRLAMRTSSDGCARVRRLRCCSTYRLVISSDCLTVPRGSFVPKAWTTQSPRSERRGGDGGRRHFPLSWGTRKESP